MKYGSNIKFARPKKGWIASAKSTEPDTIFIRTNPIWDINKERDVVDLIIRIIPHETIHNILWKKGLDPWNTYDNIRNDILDKHTKLHNFYYSNM